MAMIARLVLVAASAGAAAKPLQHLDPTQDVETRLAALLPTLSVEQLMTQTLHLWTKVNMDMINETYSKTGVGAAYSNHPTGDSSCDTDPACNLKARLALNRELMKTCGIPVTFVAESLHSPWITQGVIMPMPVALGSSWNNSLLTEVGAAIAAEATACASTRGFSPEINVCTDPRFGRTQVRSNCIRAARRHCCIASGLRYSCCSLLPARSDSRALLLVALRRTLARTLSTWRRWAWPLPSGCKVEWATRPLPGSISQHAA